jgi:dipeptidyl aminopeptidase/acylaminoacyl peptidase
MKLYKLYFIVILNISFLHSITSQSITLTPEMLWKLGRVSLDDISKDKKWVLYGISDYDLTANKSNRNLFVQDINSSSPKQLTTLDGSEWNARFTPDGSKVAFIFKGNMWEVGLDGSNPHKVSDIEMSGFEFSPNGKMILFTADYKFGKTIKELYPDLPYANARIYDDLMYRHWDSWSDDKASNVHFISYSDGMLIGDALNIQKEAFDSPLAPDGGISEISWSSDSKYIAYTCKKKLGTEYAISTNSDIYLYELANGKTTNVSEGIMGYDKNPRFSPDGKYLVWTSMERDGFEADKTRLMLLDLTDPSQQKTDITSNIDREAEDPQWSADSKKIYFQLSDQGTLQIAYYDLTMKRIVKFTNGIQNYNAFFLGKDVIIAEKTTLTDPQEIVKIESDGTEKPFSSFNTKFWNTIKKPEVKKRMVKTKDGKDMLAWVVYPPDFNATKKYPTILYCQGGPQSTINQFFSYRWNLDLMASKGYIVIAPNRRGLHSFGKEWNDEISGDYGGKAMQDLLSAIDDISKEPYVDKTKRGAVGASFGGYSVYWLAGNHEKRFKAFIAHAGMFNITSWYGTTEETFFANWDQKGPYWKKPTPKSYTKFSPNLYVDKWDTPILVTHGEKDYRVPISEGMQAFNAARLRGIPSKFLVFPEENHWITVPQNSVLWQREFFNWLDTYLK